MNRNHTGHNIVKFGKNTQESPGNLSRCAVTQTPVEEHQLKLVWKTWIIIIIVIPPRRPDLVMINKKKSKPAEFWTLVSRCTTVGQSKKPKR